MKSKIISILALLLTVTQGAWAQEKTYTQYTATAGTSGSYENSDYTKLVDNIDNVKENKWCTPFGDGGLYIEFNTPSAIIPTGYTMITGDDTQLFPNRNPKSWTLKGKLNPSDEWLILATVSNDNTLPSANFTATSFTISNTGGSAFKYFRLEISAVHNEKSTTDGSTQKFQLSEMRLKGTDASFPTYTPTSGTTAGTYDIRTYSCLFDGQIANIENKWCIPFNGSLYVEFNTAAPIIPAGYTLNTGGDTQLFPNRNPKSWTLKGKLNPSDEWTTLDTKTDDTSMPAENLTPVNFDISNTKPYKYFRFEVSAVHNEKSTSDGSTQKFQLSEMSLTGSNAASYTVTYNGNGSTSGSVPTGGSHWQNSSVTVASAGDLSKTGYTFAGWLNSVDGNTYAADQSFTITSNTTLTAQWTAIASYNVTANSASEAYWATFYSNAGNYQAPEGTQVFTVSLEGTGITMHEVSDRIAKSGEGVVLKKTTTGNFTMTLTETAPAGDFSSNSLTGTMTVINTTGANDYYVLGGKSGAGFYKLSNTSGTIGANKAYLTYSGALARGFFLFDETTGIEMPTAEDGNADAVVYDLQGRRVLNPTKGLYIVNGKKVFINK